MATVTFIFGWIAAIGLFFGILYACPVVHWAGEL